MLASTAVSTAEHALVRDLGRRARELLDALTRRPPGGTVDAPTRDALRAASDEAAALARTGDAAGKHRLMGGTVVSQASAVVSQLIGAVSARSTAFRHGVRLAVLLVLGWAVAHLLDLPRGYWVPLTAALVLKPEHDGTVVRGGSRIVGTCAGAAVVGFVAVALHPQWAGIAALVTVMTAIGLVTFRSSPAVGIAGYSAAIVLLLGFAASDTAGTAFARVLDALIGGVLAIAVYVLWPGPSIPDLGRAVARALRSERDALADLHRFVTGRGSAGRRRDARAAWAAAVIAEDAVSQAAAGGAQPIDLERARTVVLSLRRLRLAAARLGRSVGRREPPPGASIGRFGEWVEGSLSTFEHDAARLAGARPAGWSRLSGDAWPGVFDEYASEVSDSVDAIAAMLSWPRPERESSALEERKSRQRARFRAIERLFASLDSIEVEQLVVSGAREHNLKDITVAIPRGSLTVITGLSGSGKSSLAFDTIYAEGQRRYVESLSAYARQFLGQMDKPDVDSIEGLSPAISIDQKTTSRNPRSTVGTVTEIYDYLRLLWARIGHPHCHICGRPISGQSAEQIIDQVMELPEGTRFMVLAPIVRGRKGEYGKQLEELRGGGLQPREGRRRAAPPRRADRARQEVQARHRGRRRPAGDEGRAAQAAGGLDRDGRRAGRRAGGDRAGGHV